MKKLTINLVELEQAKKDENGNWIIDEETRLGIMERVFLVDTIKNSIDFKPGEKLSQDTVTELITLGAFDVNVRRPKDSDFPSG